MDQFDVPHTPGIGTRDGTPPRDSSAFSSLARAAEFATIVAAFLFTAGWLVIARTLQKYGVSPEEIGATFPWLAVRAGLAAGVAVAIAGAVSYLPSQFAWASHAMLLLTVAVLTVAPPALSAINFGDGERHWGVVALLAIPVALAWVVVALVVTGPQDDPTRAASGQIVAERRMVRGLVPTACLSAAALTVCWVAIGTVGVEPPVAWTFVSVVAVLYGWITADYVRDVRRDVAFGKLPTTAGVAIGAVVVLSFVVLAVVTVPGLIQRRVERGEPFKAPLGLLTLDVVQVNDSSEKCHVHLGDSNGLIVLLDPETDTALRIPTDTTSLQGGCGVGD